MESFTSPPAGAEELGHGGGIGVEGPGHGVAGDFGSGVGMEGVRLSGVGMEGVRLSGGGPLPFRRGNGTAAASASSMASGVTDSLPIEERRSYTGFNSHGGCGFTSTSSSTGGFLFPPSPYPARCDSVSASPISPASVRPPSWDRAWEVL